MNPQHVLRFIGILILFLGASMAAPLLVSILYQDGSTFPLLWSMLITACLGMLLFKYSKRNGDTHLNHRDGVAIVTFGWVAAGLAGAAKGAPDVVRRLGWNRICKGEEVYQTNAQHGVL